MLTKFQILCKIPFSIRNWYDYLWDYAGRMQPRQYTLKLRNGLQYILRGGSGDRGIFTEIWLRQLYNPKGFEIHPNDTVIDIGAHIGVFSVYAASKADQGRVIALEPFQDNFQLLQKNRELNHLDNLTIIAKAVGAQSGQRELFMADDSSGGHSLYFGKNRKTISVTTISFQELITEQNIQKIDFLKMDCEGSEYEIFYPLPDTIWSIIQKISMEFHEIDEQRNIRTLKQLMESKGFTVEYIPDPLRILYAQR